MTVLITGGAGFVASHLAERLLRETEDRLVLLDNFNDYYSTEMKRSNAAALAGSDRVVVEEGDFCNGEYCHQLLAKHRPEYVVHLGAYPGVPLSLKQPELYVMNNVVGTTALLEAARRYPVRRFLFASSSTVYGLGIKPPFAEDGPMGVPASPYGATKRSAEILGQTYHRLFGVPFTSLRFFNVYGPRLRTDLALTIFTRKILSGEPLPLYGDGSILRDFTHVSDICAGVIAAFTAENIGGECINLGHNEPIEVRRLIALIEEAAGRKAVIERHPTREGDMPLTCADLTKAKRLLGYEPKVPIEEGVKEYVDWMRKEGAEARD